MNYLKEFFVFAQTAAFTSKERKDAACLRGRKRVKLFLKHPACVFSKGGRSLDKFRKLQIQKLADFNN
jgi:hypothetical protein